MRRNIRLLDQIKLYERKVRANLCSKEYAKAYCYGCLDTSNVSHEDYNEIANLIDTTFN